MSATLWVGKGTGEESVKNSELERKRKKNGSRRGDGYENSEKYIVKISFACSHSSLLSYSFDQSGKFEIPKVIIQLNPNSYGSKMEMSLHFSVPSDRKEAQKRDEKSCRDTRGHHDS